MQKVNNIEQLKALTPNESVNIVYKDAFKNNHGIYKFACIHPMKSVNGVILVDTANISKTRVITDFNIQRGDVGDVYIGEYDDKQFLEILIQTMKDTAESEINSLEAYFNTKYYEELHAGEPQFDEEDESEDDNIIVENGEMFDGTRAQFEDSFFSNGTNENIKDWCFDNDWSLKINGKEIL